MKKYLIMAAVLLVPLLGFSAGFAQDLTPAEQQAMNDTMQHALEQNQANQGSEWVNPDADHSGVVAPIRTFNNDQGQPCREFIKKIYIGGKEEQGYGTACRQPDGSWKIVSGQQQAPPPSTPPQVYINRPAESYYSYPPGLYYQTPIYLSFGYFYRHGTGYRGTFHMRGDDFWRNHRSRIYPRRFWVPRYEPYRRHDRFRYDERHRDRDDRRDWDDRRGGDWGRHGRHGDRD